VPCKLLEQGQLKLWHWERSGRHYQLVAVAVGAAAAVAALSGSIIRVIIVQRLAGSCSFVPQVAAAATGGCSL